MIYKFLLKSKSLSLHCQKFGFISSEAKLKNPYFQVPVSTPPAVSHDGADAVVCEQTSSFSKHIYSVCVCVCAYVRVHVLLCACRGQTEDNLLESFFFLSCRFWGSNLGHQACSYTMKNFFSFRTYHEEKLTQNLVFFFAKIERI